MNAEEFAQFIADNKRHNNIEDRILGKLRKALKESGNPIVAVDDTEETTEVKSRADLDRIAFNLDEFFLITQSGAWVRFIMGEGYDCVADYNVSLEDALQPVFDWIEERN